jgi:hypothetical protein
MKTLLSVLGLGMLLCLLSACGKSDSSPQIVCDMNGTLVPTGFTFDEFKQTLATEHGTVEATGHEQLKTKSLAVFFKALPTGKLLAERAVLLKTGKVESPALIFGLPGAVPAAVPVAAPTETPASNAPAASPATP